MKHFNNYLLFACALCLLALFYFGLRKPLHFKEQKNERELVVKTYLLKIRKAEEAFKNDSGYYASNFDLLIKKGYLHDSLQYVPFSEGEKFSLASSLVPMQSGADVPVMECGAQYKQYLKGMNEQMIAQLIEQDGKTGNYPGLVIGNLTTPNSNAGNWE